MIFASFCVFLLYVLFCYHQYRYTDDDQKKKSKYRETNQHCCLPWIHTSPFEYVTFFCCNPIWCLVDLWFIPTISRIMTISRIPTICHSTTNSHIPYKWHCIGFYIECKTRFWMFAVIWWIIRSICSSFIQRIRAINRWHRKFSRFFNSNTEWFCCLG